MKEKHQDHIDAAACAFASPTLEEQIDFLNNSMRKLMQRIDRLEQHTHDKAGNAVIKLTLASLQS